MHPKKRFRRLSALTSVLLIQVAPQAHAQAPAQPSVPINKPQCDQMTGDVLGIAVEKLGVNSFTDYLKASNIDNKLSQLCAEGNYAGAHAIAVQEISSFRSLPDPATSSQSAPSRDKSQCYLTTACCQVVGLDDDCFELRALRRFRDTVLITTPEGRREVAQYYQDAPLILARLAAAGRIAELRICYMTHILPCAVLASLGLHAAALSRYRSLVGRLRHI